MDSRVGSEYDTQRPQFGEIDEELAKQQQVAPPGKGHYDRLQRNPLQQFPGIGHAHPVPAGRQIGFELLGYVLFSLILSFFMVLFGGIIFSEYFERGNDLLNNFIFSGNFDFMVEYMKHQMPYNLINAVITALLLALLLVASGRTPGGLLGGYHMVDVGNGQLVKFSKALAYYAVYSLAAGLIGIAAFLIWLSPLFDSRTGWSRGWLYRMIGAVAVDTRRQSFPS